MEYKVLVTLFVPRIEERYEVYIPINKTIGEVLQVLIQMVQDSVPNYISNNDELYNRISGYIYQCNDLVRDVNIRNGTELVLC